VLDAAAARARLVPQAKPSVLAFAASICVSFE
jgi:hypothetical protein